MFTFLNVKSLLLQGLVMAVVIVFSNKLNINPGLQTFKTFLMISV